MKHKGKKEEIEDIEPIEDGDVIIVPIGSSMEEQLLRTIVQGYEDNYNRVNDKNDINITATITTQKVPMEEGNKDVAYLRIDRGLRPKDFKEETIEGILNDGWEWMIVHQEIYIFNSLKERVDPRALWKKQLYINAVARLASAGIEYAELLRRLKQQEKGRQMAGIEDQGKDLVITDKMPTPLSEDDKAYVEHIKNEKAKLTN